MGILLAASRHALHLLPGREARRGRRGALHGGDHLIANYQRWPPLLPPRHGLPYLPRQRPRLRRNFLSMMFKKTKASTCRRKASEGARRALHPPRRSRTELLDSAVRRRRLLQRRPLLGHRADHVAALLQPLPGARQRGGADEDAARDRLGREHPCLPREKVKAARTKLVGFGHRVYKLRPRPGTSSGTWRRSSRQPVQPLIEITRELESARSTTSTSPRADCPTSTSTRGSSTRTSSPNRCSRSISPSRAPAGWIGASIEMKDDPSRRSGGHGRSTRWTGRLRAACRIVEGPER